MYLKKLELVGFKSFANKTQIYFDRGVTCVVGPNGCGKSNISDAMRWVLGERKAKLLRGSKMEDVIFAGTQFRKPLAYAEVSLTIDNEDRGLPIDYKEVTITRRLHRTGESEYLLNKTQCRLKDIQDLILDTGIGSNSYSMIEQGRIDYILRADPNERRFLIEEAAGISKYKVKKDEAVRKLERTEQNLLRLRDIVAEVQRNIQYAERQAKRAKKYQEQFDELKELELKHGLFNLKKIETDKNEANEQQRIVSEALEQLGVRISEIRTAQETLIETLNVVQQRYSEEEGKRYEIINQIEKNEQQLKFHQEKQLSYAERQGEIKQEEEQLKERFIRGEAELKIKREEVHAVAEQRSEHEASHAKAKASLDHIEVQLNAIKNILNQSKNEAYEAQSKATKIRNDYHRVCAFLETSTDQKKKHDAGADRYQGEMQQWSQRKGDCEESLRQIEDKINTFAESANQYKQEIASLKEKSDDVSQKISESEKSLHELETRKLLLEEMDAAIGLKCEDVLNELTSSEAELVCNLRDVLTVEDGYEWALEAALGDFAKCLVTDNLAVTRKLLGLMSEKNSVPTGIILNDVRSIMNSDCSGVTPSHPLIKGKLIDKVHVKDGYQHLLAAFLENTYVIDRIETESFEALLDLSARFRIVSCEGAVLGPQRRIYFRKGYVNSEQSLFKRGNEIEEIGTKIKVVQNALREAMQNAERINTELGTKQGELSEIEEQYLDAKIEKESYESLRKGMDERLGSFQKELDLIYDEKQAVINREQEAIEERTQLEIALMRIEERQSRAKTIQENHIRDMERLEVLKTNALKEFADQKAQLDNLIERKRYLDETIELLSETRQRDEDRLNGLKEEQGKIASSRKQLEEEDVAIEERQASLRSQMQEVDQNLSAISMEKSAVEEKVRENNRDLEEAQESKHSYESQAHELEKKLMDFGYAEKNIYERIQQNYKVDLHEVNPDDYPLTQEEKEATFENLEKLRGKVESMGTVNLLAIEEFDELKERYDYLMGQQQDLEDARSSLMEAIRKINRTTKGLFEHTFNDVNATFKEYYGILFRGGEAQLIMVDEANPLESGIDIVVRPPGKKLQHISLLSGGEKAMTALALMFALFKIKPSPFCVMDEVDAPLDEANIDRFLNVLKTFLKMSQFIIVTHSRKTIAMGDSLYGVTMQEAGVSKIVSVKVGSSEEEAFLEKKPEKKQAKEAVTADS